MDRDLILRRVAEENQDILQDRQAMFDMAMQLQQLMMMYESAVKQITTKCQILEDEFASKHLRNPIAGISCRIKEPLSIAEKLQRKNLPVTIDNMVNRLYDIAGIRITCPFISDVYQVAEMLLQQDDISLIELKDYIKEPKPSGYRSLHVIVRVSVYFSDEKREIPVEIQIRTIAMDFWASLEHQLHYKKDYVMPANVKEELYACADTIHATDLRMQELAKNLPDFVEKHGIAATGNGG